MTPKNGNRPLIPYIRQSRKKEKTISLDEQRRVIEGWAKANKVQLAPEVVEQGVSGSKDWHLRALGDAVRAVEDGQAQGIVVAFQDRLSRENGLATAEVWQALEQVQARLVCAGEGLDTATGDHEMLFTIKAAIAREQWKRHRTNWESARRSAVERGIHITPTLPAGYDRDPNTRRLVPNEHASVITAAFEARAKGASWTKVAQLLTDAGVPTSHQVRGTQETGLPWTAKSAVKTLANRVYLGEARSGEIVHKDAHPALVTPGQWARVQGRRQKGDYADPNRERALLASLCHCATCGGSLTMDSTRRNEKVYPFYRCKGQSRCSSRATIGASRLEEFVTQTMLTNAVLPQVKQPREGNSPEYEAALARVDEATAKLDGWTASWTTAGVSPETAAAMAAGLESERDEALEALNALPSEPASMDSFWEEARRRGYDTSEAEAIWKRASEGSFKASPEFVESYYAAAPKAMQRESVERILADVVVKPGRGPVEERVTVMLREGFQK